MSDLSTETIATLREALANPWAATFDVPTTVMTALLDAAEENRRLREAIEALADEWQTAVTWDGRIEPVARAYGRALVDRLLTTADPTPRPEPTDHADPSETTESEAL